MKMGKKIEGALGYNFSDTFVYSCESGFYDVPGTYRQAAIYGEKNDRVWVALFC